MSRAKTRQNIRNIENKHKNVLSKLLEIDSMLRGSYALVYTKCGKHNCWCKNERGHPHSRITWSEEGKPLTRKVPHEHIAWIGEVTNSYRRFRSLRRKMISLETEMKQLLDILEKDLVEHTRKGKDFLDIEQPNRKTRDHSVPKKRK